MVTDHHDGIALIELLHHAQRMAGPGVDQADIGGQHRGDEIASGVMRILDPDFPGTGRLRALDRGHCLARHLLAEFRIIAMGLLGLVPMGDSGHTLDIDTYIDFHDMPLAGWKLHTRRT